MADKPQNQRITKLASGPMVMSGSRSSLSESSSLVMQVNIPELKVHRKAKLNWDMTAVEAVQQLCRKHRFEAEKYGLFLHLDDMTHDSDTFHLTENRVMVKSTHEKANRSKKRVMTEEDGKLGVWLIDSQELMSYPSLETAMVDLRMRPEYVSVLFQNGEWVAEFRYRQDITLSLLLSLAMFVGKKIIEITSSGETSQSSFLVDTTGHNADTNDEGTWPQTLFFERRNIWLEQTSSDLKSQGILAGDVLELKSKPKLVRVFIESRSKMLKYMPTTLVQNVTEELWKGFDDASKEDVGAYGIFLSHDGKRFEEAGEGLWLAPDKRLASYNLNFDDSLYFSKLPEQQRRKKSLVDPSEQTKSVVVVDIFTSTPYLVPFDFDTTVRDVIVEFLQRVSHKHYLSIISDLSLYVPAHDDCMCSKIQTTTINDPLVPASPLPMRCAHGKWLKDNSLLSQASLLECDYLEVRQKGYEDGEGCGGASGLVERLQLLPKLGIDEEAQAQKQFMGHAGLLVELAVIFRPVSGDGEVNFINHESDVWERLFIPISLSTTVEDLKKSVDLLAPSLTLPTSDSVSLFLLNRKKFPKKKSKSKIGMLASLPSQTSYFVPNSGVGSQVPRSSIRSTATLENQAPSLFMKTHQTSFTFSDIRLFPKADMSDLVINHLVGESVLFIYAQERPLQPMDHFQAIQDSRLEEHDPLQSSISSAFTVSVEPPSQSRFVVTVENREKNTKTAIGYEHKTSVKDLAEFVSQLEQEQNQDQEGKKFGMFLPNQSAIGEGDGEAGIWLKEKRTLVSYGLLDLCSDSSEEPIFSCKKTDSRLVVWKRKPVHIDASVFPQLLAFKSGKSTPNQPKLLGENIDVFSNRVGKLFEVEPFISAETLISKALQGLETDEPISVKDLGLFFPQSSTWLSGGDSLSESLLQEQSGQLQVHIRLRPQHLPISVMLCQEAGVKKSEGGGDSKDETPVCSISTKVLELDVGKPFKDGVLPGCCTEFGISNAGTFRMDLVRRKAPSGGASAEEVEQTLKELLDLTATRAAELRGEVKEGETACLVGFDLSQPVSVQGVDFETDMLLLQYLPPTQDDDDEGVNIWEEPPSSEDNIQYEEEEGDEGFKLILAAATLNKLVEELTTAEKVDTEFLHAFLLTYQSFTTPFVFLNKLIQRFNVPPERYQHMSQEEFELHIRDPIRVRVVNVLRKWIEVGFEELSEEVLSRVTEFGQMISGEKNTQALGAILNGALRKAKGRRAHFVQFDQAPPPPKKILGGRSLYDESLTILDIDEEEIARQISIVDFNHFRAIKPPELLNQAWAKPKLQYRARNVLKMISWFNHISKLTSYLILSTEDLKKRGRVVSKLITIAKFCRQYNNFGAVMGIIAGFNNAAILRLKVTMAQVPKKSLEIRQELEDLMGSGNSYRAYRTAMRDANPPLIPYMGVHLSDLTFIDEGNPDKIGKLVNFGKRKLVSKVIAGLQQYQASPYNLDTVPRIVKLLSKKLNYTDDDLYKMSLQREPRGSQGKK